MYECAAGASSGAPAPLPALPDSSPSPTVTSSVRSAGAHWATPMPIGRPADLDPQYVVRHRAFIANRAGLCGGYHMLEAGNESANDAPEDDRVSSVPIAARRLM
jgi:hypothetical protein